jgi:type III restriction enzyme
VLDTLKYQPISEELWIQHLRTDHREVLAMEKGGVREVRLEDYVVGGLIDFNDISYDEHADLLYDLASQTVHHFRGYLEEDDIAKVLQCHQREIASFIHAQMQEHFWEEEGELEVKVSCGFTDLRQSAYAHLLAEPTADYRISPTDKSNMSKYLFGGFSRCLFPVQKFHSEAERRLAVILERDALKWFKPAKGQFQIYYRQGTAPMEYQPDFVAETDNTVYMLEPKASNQMNDPVVLAKKESAQKWCGHASTYAADHGGKLWSYVLIPHDEIAVNMTLEALVKRFIG